MTDMGRMAHLAPASSQLPPSNYFDQKILAQEKSLIFEHSGIYVGHE